MLNIKVLGKVKVSHIPPQQRSAGSNGGMRGGRGEFQAVFDQLMKAAPGEAIVARHAAPVPSVLSARFHGALSARRNAKLRGRVTVRVRGNKAYFFLSKPLAN